MILLPEYLGLRLQTVADLLCRQEVEACSLSYRDPRGNAPGDDARVVRAQLDWGRVILTYCDFRTEL